jgi:hypothetical protein
MGLESGVLASKIILYSLPAAVVISNFSLAPAGRSAVTVAVRTNSHPAYRRPRGRGRSARESKDPLQTMELPRQRPFEAAGTHTQDGELAGRRVSSSSALRDHRSSARRRRRRDRTGRRSDRRLGPTGPVRPYRVVDRVSYNNSHAPFSPPMPSIQNARLLRLSG